MTNTDYPNYQAGIFYGQQGYSQQLAGLTAGYTTLTPDGWSEMLQRPLYKTLGDNMTYAGSKPLVVCNGTVTECKDLEDAQSKAESLAHQHSADAFILKPVKKVAPKRDVVTTDL